MRMLRWWLWTLCLAPALLAPAATWAGDDDDEESVIEIDSGADPSDEPEDRTKPDPSKDKPKTAKPRRQPGEKHPLVRYENKEKEHRIGLPDDWVATESYVRDSPLSFDVLLPGAETKATVAVLPRDDLGDPRTAPIRWREGTKKQDGVARIDVFFDKVPRMISHSKRDNAEWVTAMAYRRILGNGFIVRLVCAEADFADAHKDFVAAALSFEADVEFASGIPKGYQTKKKGRYCFALHPKVKSSKIKFAQKVIANQEKRFTKFHGALPKPEKGAPTVVFFHRDRSQASRILEAAANASSNHFTDTRGGRLFTVPVNKNDKEQAGLLASEAQALFYVLKYGQNTPLWAFVGERAVARGEEATGKRLPYLHEGMVHWRTETSIGKLDALPGIRETERDSYWRQSFFYVCFFHAGAKKYKAAYKAFLEDLATNFDPAAAQEKHIAPLGYDQIRTDAREFVNFKLVAFRPK